MRQIVTNNEHIINRICIIKKAGFSTLKSFAISIGKPRQSVCGAVKAQIKTFALHEIMAAALQTTIAELWPDLYCVVPVIKNNVNTISHDAKVNEEAAIVN
jgi:lambda repressor-like predicted transcriptional regulator